MYALKNLIPFSTRYTAGYSRVFCGSLSGSCFANFGFLLIDEKGMKNKEL